MLFENDFYSIAQGKLLITSLTNTNKKELVDLTELLGPGIKPFRIEHIDEKIMILEAMRYDASKPLKYQWTYSLYQIDKYNLTARLLDIPEYDGGQISAHEGRIYYADRFGKICHSENNIITHMGIEGRCPTISPDGSKLAFISFVLVAEGVYVYDFRSNHTSCLMTFFGPNSVTPIIRWSSDSSLLAIKNHSDLSSTSLYMIESSSGSAIREFEKDGSCNWFFLKSEKIEGRK